VRSFAFFFAISFESNYTTSMSYLTLAVEIDHGKVVAKEPSKLPEKASGLLTILQPGTSESGELTPLQALDALQKHLCLDAGKAEEWMATVRAARR
jgi:hypothetical protein